MIATTTPDHLKGRAFGPFNLITGLVGLLGNTLAGWLWHSHGSAAPFLVAAGVTVAALMGLALHKRA
jgi:hypothetical protein